MAAAAPAAVETAATSSAVFQVGKLAVEVISVDHEAKPTPPIPILLVAPKDAGKYPVAILLHGFILHNNMYQGLLKHMASHGFIMVAPQFHLSMMPAMDDTEDIAATAKVTDWLPEGLPSLLPAGVEADLGKLGLAGHSRGGHTAFSLALGHATTKLPFSALAGIDPVAGNKEGRSSQMPPKILTYEASSMELGGMPVLVIGTGLGEEKKNILCPPCAPKDVNHKEFYRECRPPCYYLVTKEYGHMDMLDDDAPALLTCFCKDGAGCKDKMRRTVAGILVAFLRASLHGDGGDLKAILNDPSGIAPTTLYPTDYRLP